MWLLKLDDGSQLTEMDVPFWDAIPQAIKIVAVLLTVPRKDAPPYVFELKGYEKYCVERVGIGDPGIGERTVGYALRGVKNGQVFDAEILSNGARLQTYLHNNCDLPERCWRKGVADGL